MMIRRGTEPPYLFSVSSSTFSDSTVYASLASWTSSLSLDTTDSVYIELVSLKSSPTESDVFPRPANSQTTVMDFPLKQSSNSIFHSSDSDSALIILTFLLSHSLFLRLCAYVWEGSNSTNARNQQKKERNQTQLPPTVDPREREVHSTMASTNTSFYSISRRSSEYL